MKQDFFLLILIVTLVVAQAQFVPRSSVDGFLSLVTNRSTDLLSICDVQELSEFPSVRPKKVINGRKNETASKITIEDPPPMATFDEWTKERLKQQPRVAPIVDSNQNSGNSQAHTVRTEEVPTRREARMPNGADSHPQRNYASKECGAKALYSNPEMQNRGALLNDKERDQYMRNPCQAAQNKFVIVELCETIQATRVQIGNYELFSSGPQDFRVSVAERSPTGDWITVGDFKAADNRELQTFHVTNNGIYSKFIRIELLTHHGSEHYCTLSVLRVYGVSMVDEYEAEAVALGSATEPPPVMVSQPAKPAYKPSPVAKAEEDVDNSSDNIVNKVVVGTIGGLKSAIKTAFSWHHDEIPHVGGSFRMTMYDWCRTCGLQKARQSKWFCYVFEAYLCTSTCSISYSPRYYAESAQKRFLKIVTFSKTCKKGVVKESPKTTPPPIPAPTRFTPKGEDGSLPASSTNHKESVFLKLNKRITSLELNMSLSSEYLSELSRRYVQQTEDMRKQHDRMLENAEEAAVKTVEDIRESLTSEIKSLRVEFKSLSARLDAVQKSTVTTAEIARRAPFEGRDDFEDDFEMDQQDEQPECFSTEPSFAYGRAGNHVWTTQQMVGIIVVVQAFSLLVFYSFYAMSCPKGANIDRVEALEKKLEALIIERRPSTTNTEEINPPTITANQRKKLRKKLKQQQKALQESTAALHCASTATASTVTGTRCPTDRSGDENGTWRIVHRGKQKKGRN
ncbi:hypothetical protein L596_014935 [Steinernema carpocapsae]|uniref:SUN domain-containing protein n=1 Tax=Steinernema carpocapsae TaxID=34508 RepID=A0A4V6A2Z9_STECR|nr:hypothetical protein L596_014935 [Steinernema carpocapsae]